MHRLAIMPAGQKRRAVLDHRTAAMHWRVDPARSHGHMGGRHLLWGHRSASLRIGAGELLWEGIQVRALSLQLAASDAAGVATAEPLRLTFDGRSLRRAEYPKVLVEGTLQVDGNVAPCTLTMRDHGESIDSAHGRRRFLTLSGPLSTATWRGLSRALGNSFITGDLRIFCHIECVPATDNEVTTRRKPADPPEAA